MTSPQQRHLPSLLTAPIWWRLPAWTVMAVLTGLAARTTTRGLVGGGLVAVAALAFQAVVSARDEWRRFAILGCLAAGIAATFVVPSGVAEVPVLVAASRIPSAWSGRGMWAMTAIATVAFAVSIGVITGSLGGYLAGIGVPVLVERSRDHYALVAERDRAQALLAELEATRDEQTRSAALQERGRIARDMHDVLAHSLAGLSVQLQGVRAVAVREGVGPAVIEPLDKAAALAKDGMAEARAAVGALRDPGGLGLDEIPALVARHPGAPTFTSVGDATPTPEAGHALYRCVQEALTNAARYAPGAAVAVDLRRDDPLVLTVTNVLPERRAVPGQGTGLGLAGMQERLDEVGGRLTAGPSDGGGWTVRAEVPAS